MEECLHVGGVGCEQRQELEEEIRSESAGVQVEENQLAMRARFTGDLGAMPVEQVKQGAKKREGGARYGTGTGRRLTKEVENFLIYLSELLAGLASQQTTCPSNSEKNHPLPVAPSAPTSSSTIPCPTPSTHCSILRLSSSSPPPLLPSLWPLADLPAGL
eukprot:760228-Hanusia_phi.AAC.2